MNRHSVPALKLATITLFAIVVVTTLMVGSSMIVGVAAFTTNYSISDFKR